LGDELNDGSNITGEFRRKRPIPIFNDRFIERPYMRKEELSLIRDNLETLVDIKSSVEPKKNNDNIINDTKVITSDLNVQIPASSSPSGLNNIKSETLKSEVINDNKNIGKITETKIPELKIGIENLKTETKQIENKSKKRKVTNMNEEDQAYNVSPEIRRQLRKAELKEFHEEDETNKAIRRAAELAEQNKKDLDDMKKSLAAENAEIRKDLKNEFGNKFVDLTGKFEKVSSKLEETCTGIDCLKKDLANMNKNMEFAECPDCGKKVVPPLSSYCPNCNAKINSWTEDDGVTPVKGWKPSWTEK